MSTIKTPVSERKRAANKANAAMSTGPKTPEGKAKVRGNALKHGLRAEQVVLPWEDPAEFEAMQATWVDEWKPPTEAKRVAAEVLVAPNKATEADGDTEITPTIAAPNKATEEDRTSSRDREGRVWPVSGRGEVSGGDGDESAPGRGGPMSSGRVERERC